jgi:cellulose synthase/poly-beta-1,6-N-acetylglucosamine synthase-like glycosyltransferase
MISIHLYKFNNKTQTFLNNNEIILKKNFGYLKKENFLNKILFSIIIPVFNTEDYIEECLYSVLSQSINQIEIICVNDGSKDKSLIILKKIASLDNRIIIINQDKKYCFKFCSWRIFIIFRF